MSEELRISVSKAKTFLDCKAKYKFNYIEKLPKKDWDHHTFGKFCHKVLENFHQQYLEGCLLPYNITMNDSWKVAWAEFKDKMNPTMKQECWDIINKYLRMVSKEKHNGQPANVIAVEKRFELQVADNLVLNGAIDRIQLDDDNVIHVCDYKTAKNKKYLKDDFFQLLTYAYVIVTEDPSIKKVRASYMLLRHDFEHMTTEFNLKDIKKAKDKFIDYANQMTTEKEFAANPTALCNFCDFLEHCPPGKAKAFNQNVYGEVGY